MSFFGTKAFALGLAVALSGAAQGQEGKIFLYTSQPDKDAAQTVAAFRAAYPKVTVDVYRSGTTEVMSKLAAEISAGDPRADVLLIADAVSMEALKAKGVLQPYPDAKVEGLRPGSFDPDKTYFGSKIITTGIAYNTEGGLKPTSWADLMKPEFKDKITMPSPLYSGAAAILLGAMSERPDLGWKFFESLRANNAAAERGNGAVLKSVAGGEKPVGILVDFMAYNAKQKGSPIDFVFPKEGVPAVTEPVAIVKATKNLPAAKAFVDFILSDAGQKLALSQGYVPTNPLIGKPDWLPAEAEINLMPMDLESIAGRTEAEKKRFSDMFGG
jgi:iron(III) transport system substrate-binding protein